MRSHHRLNVTTKFNAGGRVDLGGGSDRGGSTEGFSATSKTLFLTLSGGYMDICLTVFKPYFYFLINKILSH